METFSVTALCMTAVSDASLLVSSPVLNKDTGNVCKVCRGTIIYIKIALSLLPVN